MPSSSEQKINELISQCLENAMKGDATAQFDLGAMYHDGDGVPQDAKKALYLVPVRQMREIGKNLIPV